MFEEINDTDLTYVYGVLEDNEFECTVEDAEKVIRILSESGSDFYDEDNIVEAYYDLQINC